MDRLENCQVPRYRRVDILDRLQRGDQQWIARMAHCSTSTVSMVLNGKQTQTSALTRNVIRIAQERARINSRRLPR